MQDPPNLGQRVLEIGGETQDAFGEDDIDTSVAEREGVEVTTDSPGVVRATIEPENTGSPSLGERQRLTGSHSISRTSVPGPTSARSSSAAVASVPLWVERAVQDEPDRTLGDAGGYHPPIMVVGGRLLAQGYDVPLPDDVVDAILDAAVR